MASEYVSRVQQISQAVLNDDLANRLGDPSGKLKHWVENLKSFLDQDRTFQVERLESEGFSIKFINNIAAVVRKQGDAAVPASFHPFFDGGVEPPGTAAMTRTIIVPPTQPTIIRTRRSPTPKQHQITRRRSSTAQQQQHQTARTLLQNVIRIDDEPQDDPVLVDVIPRDPPSAQLVAVPAAVEAKPTMFFVDETAAGDHESEDEDISCPMEDNGSDGDDDEDNRELFDSVVSEEAVEYKTLVSRPPSPDRRPNTPQHSDTPGHSVTPGHSDTPEPADTTDHSEPLDTKKQSEPTRTTQQSDSTNIEDSKSSLRTEPESPRRTSRRRAGGPRLSYADIETPSEIGRASCRERV